jgi:hypothetical protein
MKSGEPLKSIWPSRTIHWFLIFVLEFTDASSTSDKHSVNELQPG